AWVARPIGALVFAQAVFIRSALSEYINGSPITVPISQGDLQKEQSLMALFRRALVRSVVRSCSIETDGRRVWEPNAYDTRPFDQQRFAIHRALAFRLAILKGKLYVLLTPEIVARTMAGEPADEEVTKVLRNAVYGYQHNNVYDADLRRWTARITDVDIRDA